MRYSNWLGTLFSLLLIIACFYPWIYIPSKDITFTGMNNTLDYHRPGIAHIFFAAIAILCFLIPKIWAKRGNVFVCAINLGWSIRNLIIIPACGYGECPEKRIWLYVTITASLLMLLMSFVPDIKVPKEE